MKDRDKEKFLRYIVKSSRITTQHPGYMYEYFTSFDEVDAYCREQCGDDWQTQDWVKVFLNYPIVPPDDAMTWKAAHVAVKAELDGKASDQRDYSVTTYVHQDNIRALLQRYYNTTGSVRRAVSLLAELDNLHLSRQRADQFLKDIEPVKVGYISISNIRDAMKYTGLTLKEIAAVLHISQPAVSRKIQQNAFTESEIDAIKRYICD